MPDQPQCPQCGAILDQVGGPCPACLLRRALEEGSSASSSEGHAVASTITIPGPTPAGEQPGQRIGPYKLLDPIAEGGMGTVWRAQQEEPVRRIVALKLIKAGMDSRQVIARFEAERQAMALMDHPHIAKVLDAGLTAQGRPFFVMEHVQGIPITQYCDQHKLPTVERLKLFMAVCRAIQHAHQKGIIHRDIKPSNILVTLHDGVPVPKVIDFGIAKATAGQQLTDKTVFTAFQQFMGTPAYMSPEQAEMCGLNIDTQSDIYALGVLLYELLTGHTPFDHKTLVARGIDEMRRVIREEEPPRPSTRLGTLEAGRQTEVARRRGLEAPRLVGALRGDLDWIVMKCLEKDRVRRYESASGLARDVERHLGHEPVEAGPPGLGYRGSKWVRRHRVGLGAAAVVGLGLALGAWALWKVQTVQRRAAEQGRPKLTQSPLHRRVPEWGEARFVVTARGAEPLAYQWFREGVVLVRATNAELVLSPVQANQAGRYGVVVGNAYGRTSAVAVLQVVPFRRPDPTRMALVPAGAFAMGDTFGDGKTNELPVHTVRVGAFYMDRTEVTQGQWNEVYLWAATNGYEFEGVGALGKGTNHPIHTIRWYDAVKWCNARSEKEGRVPAYYTESGLTNVYRTGEVSLQNAWVRWVGGYRLPTEAEWEKAARAGGRQRFGFEDTITHGQANYDSRTTLVYDVSPTRGYHRVYAIRQQPYTSPVGSFPANRYGLHDMAGNVFEWCWDWYGESYYGKSPPADPQGPASGSYRVLRGGSWYGYASLCRAASRYYITPDYRNNTVGFRAVLPSGQP